MTQIDHTKENVLYVSNEEINILSEEYKSNGQIDYKKIRKKVEPWFTALFQSEHLSLLVGSGLSIALGDKYSTLMKRFEFQNEKHKKIIQNKANEEAKILGRGEANFEDDLRVALKLLDGYNILNQSRNVQYLKNEINKKMIEFIGQILHNEKAFLESNSKSSDNKEKQNNGENSPSLLLLKNFLLSFGSRTATRERLDIFTTNYDRFIEFGLDEAGFLTLDRFIGKLNPTMRFQRMDLDYHYNPPGIRGEPRYVEGVVKYTKLHGSIDWKFSGDKIVKIPLPFGSNIEKFKEYFEDVFDSVVIFPNSSKAYETSFFPYSELFRDFSSAVCRPNSVLVTYGYSFGDSHINRIIIDMLTIPSTHLVIISYDDASERISKFKGQCNESQLTLLVGKELGDFEKLVNYYLPKPAIDRISERERRILEKRNITDKDENKEVLRDY